MTLASESDGCARAAESRSAPEKRCHLPTFPILFLLPLGRASPKRAWQAGPIMLVKSEGFPAARRIEHDTMKCQCASITNSGEDGAGGKDDVRKANAENEKAIHRRIYKTECKLICSP